MYKPNINRSIIFVMVMIVMLLNWKIGRFVFAMAGDDKSISHLPLVLKDYPSLPVFTITPEVPTITATITNTFTPTVNQTATIENTLTPTMTQTPTFSLTPTEVITSSTFYLWSDGVIETTPGKFIVSERKCYTGCRSAERWDISLTGDMVGNEYEVLGKFVFYSIDNYSIPFRIILVRNGVEQTLVEYTLSGPGSKELTNIKWNGPDPSSAIGDTLIFEIDVRGEIGTLEVHYLGEGSGIRVPVVTASQQDTRYTHIHTLPGYADAIYPIDLDRDGDIDLLGSDFSTQDVSWWEDSGNQNFNKHVIDSHLDIPMENAVFAEDMDNDGDKDVLSTIDSSNSNEIAWYENDGNQHFTKHLIPSSYINPKSIFAGDLDKDGDIDVLAGGTNLVWFQNNGDQTFSRTIIDTKNGISCVSMIDLDKDGDFDILGATLSAAIYWWRNDGGGIFTPITIRTGSSTTTGSRSWVIGADLDDDGDNDIVGTAALDNEIAWWENDGGENFMKHVISYGLGSPVTVSLGDVDGDGDMDILSGGAAFAWWENLGNGRYIRHLISSSEVKSLYALEINGDDRLDFFKSNGLLTWYENIGE